MAFTCGRRRPLFVHYRLRRGFRKHPPLGLPGQSRPIQRPQGIELSGRDRKNAGPARREQNASAVTRCDVHFRRLPRPFRVVKQAPATPATRSGTHVVPAYSRPRVKPTTSSPLATLPRADVHIALWPWDGTTISAILRSIKLSVARRVWLWARENSPESLRRMEHRPPNGKVAYRFWQRGGGRDRNLQSDRDVHEKIAYVHDNPVRRGLVKQAEDWPWSSFWAHYHGRNEPIAIDRESIPVVLL